ncbi:unnamed protein product [Discula destructiva]
MMFKASHTFTHQPPPKPNFLSLLCVIPGQFLKLIPSKLALLALLPLSLAGPLIASTRAPCAYTCGSVCYWQSDVDEAVAQGYNYYKSGQQVGSNDYPHTETNYEHISFYVAGPYEEFPILKTYTTYTGGSPGPDRVVFNGQGKLAGVVTHTGASGNDFVTCSGCCA